MVIEYKDRTHASKGNAGETPHAGGGKHYSGAIKNRLRKSLDAREERLALKKRAENKANKVPKPKRKPPVPKVPLIKPKAGPTKVRPPEYKESQIKKPKDNSDFMNYMEDTQAKKHGGSVKTGKVVKTNMTGDGIVQSCYT